MHKSGDQMSTEIVHADGKKEMPNSVEYFDFGFQDPTMLEPYTITPGDALITRVRSGSRCEVKFCLATNPTPSYS